MDTAIRGSSSNIFKAWSSGDGVMYYGGNTYFYDVETFGTPEASVPWVSTIEFGGSSKTPEQISGWSLDLNLDMIVGAHMHWGLSDSFWFSGNNSSNGSIGLNIGLSLSLSRTTIFGPVAPHSSEVPQGIAVVNGGQYVPFQPGIQQGVPAGDVLPASGQPSGGQRAEPPSDMARRPRCAVVWCIHPGNVA